MEVEKENLECEALLRDLNSYISVAKYFNFDAGIPATESIITEHEIAWQKKHTQKDCINAIVNEDNVCEEAKKILDDDGEEDGIQEEKLTFAEYLAMLDKINKCYPPRMRRRSNVLFRSHIGWEIADHAETSSRRQDWYMNEMDLFETSLWRFIGRQVKPTNLTRPNDVPVNI